MLKYTFFKCEITTIMVGNFETTPSVNVTKKKRFTLGVVSKFPTIIVETTPSVNVTKKKRFLMGYSFRLAK